MPPTTYSSGQLQSIRRNSDRLKRNQPSVSNNQAVIEGGRVLVCHVGLHITATSCI